MTGGVVVSVMSTSVPSRVEIVETPAVVTIFVFADERTHLLARRARREIFVPLYGPLSCRTMVDGSYAPDPSLVAPAA